MMDLAALIDGVLEPEGDPGADRAGGTRANPSVGMDAGHVSAVANGLKGIVNADRAVPLAQAYRAGAVAGAYRKGTYEGGPSPAEIVHRRALADVATHETLRIAAHQAATTKDIDQSRHQILSDTVVNLPALATTEKLRTVIANDVNLTRALKQDVLRRHVGEVDKLTLELADGFCALKRRTVAEKLTQLLIGNESSKSDPDYVAAVINKSVADLAIARATKGARLETAQIEHEIEDMRQNGRITKKDGIPKGLHGYAPCPIAWAHRDPETGEWGQGVYPGYNRPRLAHHPHTLPPAGIAPAVAKHLIVGSHIHEAACAPCYVGLIYLRRTEKSWIQWALGGALTPWKRCIEDRAFAAKHSAGGGDFNGWYPERWGAPENALPNNPGEVDMDFMRYRDVNNCRSILASYSIMGMQSSTLRALMTTGDDWARTQGWTHTRKVIFHSVFYEVVMHEAIGMDMDRITTDALERQHAATWGSYIERTLFIETILLAVQHLSIVNHLVTMAAPKGRKLQVPGDM